MKGLSKNRRRYKFHPRRFTGGLRFYLLTLFMAVISALAFITNPASSAPAGDHTPEEAEHNRTSGKLRPGLEGQATLEWVLIGGLLVVIIVGLLTTILRPQLEAIITAIMNTIQQNTAAK